MNNTYYPLLLLKKEKLRKTVVKIKYIVKNIIKEKETHNKIIIKINHLQRNIINQMEKLVKNTTKVMLFVTIVEKKDITKMNVKLKKNLTS